RSRGEGQRGGLEPAEVPAVARAENKDRLSLDAAHVLPAALSRRIRIDENVAETHRRAQHDIAPALVFSVSQVRLLPAHSVTRSHHSQRIAGSLIVEPQKSLLVFDQGHVPA